LKQADNELLTRTDAGTAMGNLFRRYWLPALTIDELPATDADPVRVPLLGEKLIAIRDDNGQAVILQEACPHRQASLYYGRCEAGGIRCPYHGWKFDANGRCVEVPGEPDESRFHEQIRITAYPTVERGGVIWVYMGPPDIQPEPPEFEWATLPTQNLFVSRRIQECNYLQTMEGGLDSSHLSWLHGGTILSDPVLGIGGSGTDSRILEIIANDRKPVYETLDTPGGLLLGARRNAGEEQYYWRITQFMAPCFNIIAPTGDLTLNAQAWVPLDDNRCWSWAINYHIDKPLSAAEREAMRAGGGLHVEFVPGTYQGKANRDNDYLLDRNAQRQGDSFTGIPSFAMQDAAVQESQGVIADRSKEQLVSSDNGIIATRMMLLQAIRDNQAGNPIPGLDPQGQRARAGSIIAADKTLDELDRSALEALPN